MKILIYVSLAIVTAIGLTLCAKKSSSEKMTAEELKAKYGIVLPDLQYKGEEEPVATSRGKKKGASGVTVTVVWEYDLSIDITGTTITGSVSPDAQWAGVQKFIDTTTVDGAVGLWECNRQYYSPPGSGTVTTCQTQGTGYYRVWSSEFDYDIRLSYFKFLP